jgi:hypothetical protein
MNEINDYIEFLNGSLSDAEEQSFAENFANNQDFRSNFKKYLLITGSIKKIVDAIEPPSNSKDMFYKRIGLYPEIVKPSATNNFWKTFLKGRLFTGMLTGIISVIATWLILSTYYQHSNSGNGKEINTEINKYLSYEQSLINSSRNFYKNEKNNIEPNNIIKNNTLTKRKGIKTFKNSGIQLNSVQATNDVGINDQDTPKKKSMIDITPSKITGLIKPFTGIGINPSKMAPISEYRLAIDELKNLNLSKENNFSFELGSSISWNIPKETITPLNFNKLNNIELSLTYKLSDFVSIGTQIKQETFFLKYTGKENDGIEYIYQRQPNYTTYSLLFRLYPINFGQFYTFSQLNLGFNTGGYVIKPSVGIEYRIYKNLSFNLGIDYNRFWYFHNSKWFDTNKFNINYGFSYQF